MPQQSPQIVCHGGVAQQVSPSTTVPMHVRELGTMAPGMPGKSGSLKPLSRKSNVRVPPCPKLLMVDAALAIPLITVWMGAGTVMPAFASVVGRFCRIDRAPPWPNRFTTAPSPWMTGLITWITPWIALWIAAFRSARSQTFKLNDGFVKSNGADVSMYPWNAPFRIAASPVKKKPLRPNFSDALPSANVYDDVPIFMPPCISSDWSVRVSARWNDESFIWIGPRVKPESSPLARIPLESMLPPTEARQPLDLWMMQLDDGAFGSALKSRQPVPPTTGGSGAGRFAPT